MRILTIIKTDDDHCRRVWFIGQCHSVVVLRIRAIPKTPPISNLFIFLLLTSLKKALQITRNQYQNVCGISVEDIQPVLQNIGKKYGWNDTRMNEVSELLLDLYDGYHFGSDLRLFNHGGQVVNCLQRLYSTNEFPERLVDINTKPLIRECIAISVRGSKW